MPPLECQALHILQDGHLWLKTPYWVDWGRGFRRSSGRNGSSLIPNANGSNWICKICRRKVRLLFYFCNDESFRYQESAGLIMLAVASRGRCGGWHAQRRPLFAHAHRGDAPERMRGSALLAPPSWLFRGFSYPFWHREERPGGTWEAGIPRSGTRRVTPVRQKGKQCSWIMVLNVTQTERWGTQGREGLLS